MSYGIIDDGDEIHIRARITQRWELAELILKLQQRVDGMPVNISTERRPWSAYSEDDKIEVASDSTSIASFTVEQGAVTSISIVNPGPKYESDAQDVNQRELKNE